MDFEELVEYISTIQTNTVSSPHVIGKSLREFCKTIESFNELSDEEKAHFWIEAFRDPNNKDACEAFAMRHPDCNLNSFVPKD